MKRRTKIILSLSAIAALGALGTLAAALRPAWLPDTCDGVPAKQHRALLNADLSQMGAATAPIDVRYVLNVTAPKGEARYIGEVEPNSFTLLRESEWNIRIYTKDGALWLDPAPLELHATDSLSHVRYSAATDFEKDFVKEKQPDGSYHAVYYVNFIVSATVTPSYWGKSTSTLMHQTLKVDPIDGTVDMVAPRTPLQSLLGYRSAISRRFPVPALPSKLGESSKEKALNYVLFTLGRVDNAAIAKEIAKYLPETAESLLKSRTDADKPWPDCWGAEAACAELCAKKIVPTLLYLQEKECFGVTELADFINSPAFARFFGESFADKGSDPLDEPMDSFPIEKVESLDQSDN